MKEGDVADATTNTPQNTDKRPEHNLQQTPNTTRQPLVSFSTKAGTIQKNNTSQTNKPSGGDKPVGYKFAGNSLAKIFKKSFPKEMIPTKITGYLILTFFLLALILGLIQFPLGKMLSGNTDITIEVGYPWPFFIMELMDPNEIPLSIKGLILDLILYTLLAYIIEIGFNYFMNSPFMKTKKERSILPKLFKKILPKKKESNKEKDIEEDYIQPKKENKEEQTTEKEEKKGEATTIEANPAASTPTAPEAKKEQEKPKTYEALDTSKIEYRSI